ncbi:Beta-aryl ether cleaving enzyme [Hartmannibacter diazotrophicus]|uniref:Beta-aryl ether cleaving enzyme n=1 Tax=Hartmannibacter diazotrophicus TaxID=1482074 RepID=A0A2C9D5H8_9HYPH|nr:glutathione S-transferase N-terminal domain-containing protein [Hartmannibacter diazotrophicus]SON55483.1 Beta-aryl ether cleaving enzyme [Hartmannibacter diazotrophicus]
MTLRLYDLCGADPKLRFSPYCWRVKLALRHKGISVETVPTPFTAVPEIGGGGFPTVPVLELEDGKTRIVESFAIAEYLEETFPDRPALFSPGPAGRASARFMDGFANMTFAALAFPLIAKDIHAHLTEADQVYFRQSREKRLGKTLEEAAAGRENKLGEFRKTLAPVRHVLRSSPYLGGESPLYVDFILAGALTWATTISDYPILGDEAEISDWLKRVTQGETALA